MFLFQECFLNFIFWNKSSLANMKHGSEFEQNEMIGMSTLVREADQSILNRRACMSESDTHGASFLSHKERGGSITRHWKPQITRDTQLRVSAFGKFCKNLEQRTFFLCPEALSWLALRLLQLQQTLPVTSFWTQASSPMNKNIASKFTWH